jgi:hypothetical protein
MNLSNEVGKRVQKILKSGTVELRLSPVVLAELTRRAEEELQAGRTEAASAIERATRAARTDTRKLLAKSDALFDKIKVGISDQINELLAIDGVALEDWPTLSAQEVGERELARLRPFMQKPVGTIGHRDALIWAGIIESIASLVEEEGDFAIFVSKDEGFRTEKGNDLHPDLQKDVNETFDGKFELVPSLFDALTIIDLHEEAITRRVANIRNALSAFVNEISYKPWDWPDTELPAELENPQLIGGDYLGGEVIGDGNPAICKFEALVQIEGAMLKDQWYLDSGSDLQLWDGEINDHYMSVFVERVVEFEVEVDLDEDGAVDYIQTTQVWMA